MPWPGVYTASYKRPVLETTAITILWIGSSMLDGGTNCGKGGTTMAAVHGPGGRLVALCSVRSDHLRRRQPTV